jgi:anthranilate phosphoribosyltransferase
MTALPEVEPHLSEDMAEDVFGLMLDGKVSDEDIARFLIELSDRGETAAEIAGAARAQHDPEVAIGKAGNHPHR